MSKLTELKDYVLDCVKKERPNAILFEVPLDKRTNGETINVRILDASSMDSTEKADLNAFDFKFEEDATQFFDLKELLYDELDAMDYIPMVCDSLDKERPNKIGYAHEIVFIVVNLNIIRHLNQPFFGININGNFQLIASEDFRTNEFSGRRWFVNVEKLPDGKAKWVKKIKPNGMEDNYMNTIVIKSIRENRSDLLVKYISPVSDTCDDLTINPKVGPELWKEIIEMTPTAYVINSALYGSSNQPLNIDALFEGSGYKEEDYR